MVTAVKGTKLTQESHFEAQEALGACDGRLTQLMLMDVWSQVGPKCTSPEDVHAVDRLRLDFHAVMDMIEQRIAAGSLEGNLKGTTLKAIAEMQKRMVQMETLLQK